MLDLSGMKNTIKIGVLMGGPSSEHEVSLNTGAVVMQNLNKDKYEAIPIKIEKDGQCLINGKLTSLEKAFKDFNLIFNALNGTFGEDGRVQALLEYYGVRYTGSGIAASALAMDKLRSREIFKLAGFCVPKTLEIKKGENYRARLNLFITKIAKLPVVVKPCSNGSSVGVSVVSDNGELAKAINKAFELDKKVLVEEFIKGREVTCGVLDNFNGELSALPVTEIVSVGKHD